MPCTHFYDLRLNINKKEKNGDTLILTIALHCLQHIHSARQAHTNNNSP